MAESIPSPSARPPRSRRLRLWLIIGSVVAALTLLPALAMAVMSPMASDAGVNTVIWSFIWVMLTFPLAIVLGPALGWLAYSLRRESVAWALLFAPFLWVAAMAVIFTLGFGTPHPV